MQMQTFPKTTIANFVNSLAQELQNLVSSDDGFTSAELTRFHAPRAPSITIRQYVERIVSYAPCTAESFVIALNYVHRMVKNQGDQFVNARTIHRIFITSVLLSAKYIDDVYFNNRYYARVGGISCAEMNSLELEFLFRLKFNCSINSEEFERFSHILSEPTPVEEVVIPAVSPVEIDALASYSVSPHTHSFMFPSCGNINTNDRSRAPAVYRRPMVTF